MQDRFLLKELKLLNERIECVKEYIAINGHIGDLACSEMWSDSYLQELWDELVAELEEKYPNTYSSECFTKALLRLRTQCKESTSEDCQVETA